MNDMNGMNRIDRRTFVRTAAGIVALAPLARAFGDDPPALVTGSGEEKRLVQHDWLTPPPGLLWGDTHGLAQDAAGRIYVSHTVHPASEKKDAIVVFDRAGKFITSWGSRFAGGGHGLDIRKESDREYLYHCDVNRRRFAKTTLDGELLWETGAPLQARVGDQVVYESQDAWNPTNVAFHPSGDVFLGDGYGKSFVHRFTKNGEWKATIATPGANAGEVSCPHGLWIDDRGSEPTLAVADRGNHRIQYFSLDGKHLRFVTGGMRQPCHFKTRGDLLLVPDLSSVVTILDKENKVVAHLCDGDPTKLRDVPREQFIPGKFVHPHTAIWLDDGSILVAEWVPIGRITRLSKLT
ncbi:MAG: hypothetical protein SGJ09_16035 [Phycisphaerae bacterium]|nr:hypothetical protein [Phycisphaerae bacterium]